MEIRGCNVPGQHKLPVESCGKEEFCSPAVHWTEKDT